MPSRGPDLVFQALIAKSQNVRNPGSVKCLVVLTGSRRGGIDDSTLANHFKYWRFALMFVIPQLSRFSCWAVDPQSCYRSGDRVR